MGIEPTTVMFRVRRYAEAQRDCFLTYFVFRNFKLKLQYPVVVSDFRRTLNWFRVRLHRNVHTVTILLNILKSSPSYF